MPSKSFICLVQNEEFDSKSNQMDCDDGDCACTPELGKHIAIKNSISFYKKAENIYSTPLPKGFRLAFSPYAPEGPSVLNPESWERLEGYAIPRLLEQDIDFQFAQQNLILPVDSVQQSIPSNPKTLTAWLHVTNACNLDCPYCYVRKSSELMDESIGLNAVEKVFQTAENRKFTSVKLKYAGGESTLNFRLIRKLSEKAKVLAAEKNINLQQVILTNGTLIREDDAQWVVANGVRIMISLDGVGDVHDQLRSYKSGKGSFQKISQTIDNILIPHGIIPMITITITKKNAKDAANGVKWALERNLPVNLNFYRHKPDLTDDIAAEEKDIIDGMMAAYKVYEEVMPTTPFINGLLDRAQMSEHSHTCGVGLSYLVITHKGFLAQCQMHLDKSVSPILNNDLILSVKNGPIQNLNVDHKEGCRSCTYRYRCAGGCPIETFRAFGRWDVSSPNCSIYKSLFPALLRLEGLRLLKVNGYN
jgi:uncharacterized protein